MRCGTRAVRGGNSIPNNHDLNHTASCESVRTFRHIERRNPRRAPHRGKANLGLSRGSGDERIPGKTCDFQCGTTATTSVVHYGRIRIERRP